jgi:ribonuclease R
VAQPAGVADPPLAVALRGVVSAHPRGFGFVATAAGEQAFVSPPQMRSLVPGDEVVFSVAPGPRGQPSATVHEVLARPESFWLGQLEPIGGGRWRLRADDPVHATVEIAAAPAVAPADVVQVRVAAGAGIGAPTVPATLIANLGPRNDAEFESRYAIARWRLPSAFGDDALAEAREFLEPSLADAAQLGYADLTALPFVTIDGASSRDFDDALCLVDDDHRRWTLHVAIAHVSHYVEPSSALDAAARERGTSVYLPDRALPMLPPELANGLCSLQPA